MDARFAWSAAALVGRELELAAARQHLGGGGGAPALLVSGEAGVGKSRLVQEALAQGAPRDYLVLQGVCFELDQAGVLAPFVDLLDAAASQPGGAVSPAAGALAAGALEALTSAMRGSEAGPAGRDLQGQLVRFLLEVSQLGPVVVVLEDLQWADEASLAAVEYLAHRLRSSPARLVLTYRSEEVGGGLGRFVEALLRRGLAERLELGPLDRAATEQLGRSIVGDARRLSRGVLDELWELTEGNPFAVEEVLRGVVLSETTWETAPLRLPGSIADSIRRRLAGLTSGAAGVAAAAAVMGRRFHIALLTQLVDQDRDAVWGAARELVRAGLVIEEAPGWFAFRHELTRRSVMDELLSVDRARLHARAAQALIDAAGPDADIAFHAVEAGLWEIALDRGGRAGRRAMEQGAPAAAEENLRLALEGARRLGRLAPELLVNRGRARTLIGDLDGAQADLAAGWAQAERVADHQTCWRARFELGVLALGTDYDSAGQHLRAALLAARKLEDPRPLSASLNRLGNWWLNRGAVSNARELQALEHLDGSGDDRGLATTLELLGLCDLLDGHVDSAHQRYQQAIDLLRRLGDREALANVLATRGGVAVYAGVAVPGITLAGVAQSLVEAMSLADELGWPAGRVFAERNLAAVELAQGRLQAALGHAQHSLALAEEIGHHTWVHRGQRVLGGVYAELGVLDRAVEQLGKAVARGTGQLGFFHVDAMTNLASVLLRGGQHDDAERVLDQLDEPRDHLTRHVVQLARAELALAQDEPHAALQLLDSVSFEGPVVAPRQLIVRSDALSALGRGDEAQQRLMAAVPPVADFGAEWWRWQLLAALARVLHRRGRRRESRSAAQEAWELVDVCARDLPAALVATLRRTAAQRIPATPHADDAALAKRWGGLTPRQREVAVLMAQGRTNQQIADTLMVSVRTIETHVKRILGQLKLRSRTELAAWAHARGLLDAAR